MDIGFMHLTALSKPTARNSVQAKIANTSIGFQSKNENFREVFKKVVASNENDSAIERNNEGSSDLEKLEDLLNKKSAEEVLDLLGIQHDEGLLMIQFGEQGQAIGLDELININLEDLLALLNIDSQQFLKAIQQLLGDGAGEINNIWDLINSLNEQAPELINQITAALQGEHKVTPKEAEQVLQFLKLIQASGESSDLVNNQHFQLTRLNELLQNILKEVHITTKTTASTSAQQVTKQTETIDGESQTNGSFQTITTRTVSITLPPEKTAQSQALVKEIQNLLNRSQFSNSQGTMKLLLKLYPENLGSIRIEVIQKDGVLSARLLASTSLGREMLDSQINQLKTAFAQQNIQMDRIDIVQSLQESDMRDQSLFSNMFKQQSEEPESDKEENKDEESMSFSDYLEQEV